MNQYQQNLLNGILAGIAEINLVSHLILNFCSEGVTVLDMTDM